MNRRVGQACCALALGLGCTPPGVGSYCSAPEGGAGIETHRSRLVDSVRAAAGIGSAVVRVRLGVRDREEPIGEAIVRLERKSVLVAARPVARTTDADGIARFDSLPGLKYELSVLRIGFMPLSRRIDFPAGYTDTLIVSLREDTRCLVGAGADPERVATIAR